ncbi:EpsG family protein [Macrococcoides caseolyticum]|uniref:EpsG family protein n=1 Tax=Macrococcoides caseolyticum TaxID=69966 RepID=UPI000C343716|nr:hypothetical protein CW672_03865 [Macrococcus caseolyticus]
MINFILLVILLYSVLLYFLKIRLSLHITNILYISLSLSLLIYLFFTDKSKFTDNYTYLSRFSTLQNMNIKQMMTSEIFEVFFRIISWTLLQIFSIENTFNIIVMITNACLFYTIYKIFDNKQLSIILILLYSLSPFIDYSQNILRQTMCISFLFLTIIIKRRFTKTLIYFLSAFLHISVIPLLLLQMFQKKLNIKFLIFIFISSIILYLTDWNAKIFGDIIYFEEYYNDLAFSRYGSENNRIDFLLVTIFISSYSLFLYFNNYLSRNILIYTLISSIYFCLMAFQAFSDRYAIYVWFLIPYFAVLTLHMIQERIKLK